jgi:hypothetical protein
MTFSLKGEDDFVPLKEQATLLLSKKEIGGFSTNLKPNEESIAEVENLLFPLIGDFPNTVGLEELIEKIQCPPFT